MATVCNGEPEEVAEGIRRVTFRLPAGIDHVHCYFLRGSGGGWILSEENRTLLCPPARLIYLKVSPEVSLHRMGAATAGRPLLNRPDPRGELEKLLEARKALYELAELTVLVDRLDAQHVTQRVLEKLQPA